MNTNREESRMMFKERPEAVIELDWRKNIRLPGSVKMRINITTVYSGENSGCFLQAWALNQQLSNMGHDVYFRGYKFNNYTPRIKFINFTKCCLRFRWRRAIDLIIKNRDYKYFQKTVKVSDNKILPDLTFFGSDTLWNFDDPYFAKHTSFFTGADIGDCPKFAYSISVGSTSKENFLRHTEAIQHIQNFKNIAVRDKHTRSVLAEIYPSENIVKTIDPTMLLNREDYLQHFSVKTPTPTKSLVIYYFGTIPAPVWKELRAFAKEKGLTIVNVGLHNDNDADMSVVATPAKFISAFANAEYIFTNTFHGCVFSTIFNKQFATDGINKKKIACFLEEFSLCDRVVRTAGDVEMVLTTPVNYSYVNELVEEGRKRSIDYLNNCIREVKAHE